MVAQRPDARMLALPPGEATPRLQDCEYEDEDRVQLMLKACVLPVAEGRNNGRQEGPTTSDLSQLSAC